MRKTTFGFAPIAAVLVVVLVCFANAQDTPVCRVGFKSPPSPKRGDTVEITGDLRGTATVPPGMFLWVFVHRQGLAKWSPQGGGSANVDQGEWVVHATYGDEHNPRKDANATFEIKAVIVGRETNTEIMNYVKQSEEKDYYPGIPLPSTDPGCASDVLAVVRR